jgi:polyferredoxin
MAEESVAEGWTTYQQTEAQSARVFVLVGFAFYLLASVVLGIFFVLSLFTFQFFVTPGSFDFGPVGFGALGVIFQGVFLGIAVGLAVWTWGTLQKIQEGQYQEARDPALVQGILGLFFAFLVGGIFLILAYAKLGNVVSPRPAYPVMAAPAPVAPQPAGGRVCPNCGRPIPMDAKFCNYCGHEMA